MLTSPRTRPQFGWAFACVIIGVIVGMYSAGPGAVSELTSMLVGTVMGALVGFVIDRTILFWRGEVS